MVLCTRYDTCRVRDNINFLANWAIKLFWRADQRSPSTPRAKQDHAAPAPVGRDVVAKE